MDLSSWKRVSRSEAEKLCRSTTGTIPVILVRPNGILETGWVIAWCDGMGCTRFTKEELAQNPGLCMLRVGYYVEGGQHHFEEVNEENNVEIYINTQGLFLLL